MRLPEPLYAGRLVKRYKRFFADIELANGEAITAHCANPGSMLAVAVEGAPVWASLSDNPKRKLKYSWELIELDGALLGVNTNNPNKIAAEAIEAGRVPELSGYGRLRREVKYGASSRVDILLEDDDRAPCYVEIKNVHLKRNGALAEFPDSVTSRGAKHLTELTDMVAKGARAVMLFVVQRTDCEAFAPAADIDPTYAAALKAAAAAGVETYCYDCDINAPKPQASLGDGAFGAVDVTLRRALPITIP